MRAVIGAVLLVVGIAAMVGSGLAGCLISYAEKTEIVMFVAGWVGLAAALAGIQWLLKALLESEAPQDEVEAEEDRD